MLRSQELSMPTTNASEHGLAPEEREARVVVQLPEREALSVAFPFLGALSPMGAAKGAETVAESIDDAAVDPST